MNWIEYKEQSSRTFAEFSYDQDKVMSDKLNEMHCVIGISTEIAEFIEAIISGDKVNASEEIGDILWYCANLERIAFDDDYDLNYNASGIKIFADEWLVGVQEMLDVYKKGVYYGSDIDYSKVIMYLNDIKITCVGALNENGFDVRDVMSKNINKLKVRYPDKFNKKDAEDRNLDAERKVLEDGDS